MIVYVGGVAHTDEIKLIKDVCAFEGISCFDLPREHWGKYYRGGRPAVVVGNEFIDVPTERRVVVYGFYNFVDHLVRHTMIRA